MPKLFLIIIFLLFNKSGFTQKNPYIVVLGVAQDAGYPQISCEKDCCRKVHEGLVQKKTVSCIALVNEETNQQWLFDATPDISDQLYRLNKMETGRLSGIFLTHAHIGHYTGLIYLGREAMNADAVPVYAMPRMHDYLEKNGPWSQLVTLNNIELRKLKADSPVQLTKDISVTPLLVPHRDEYSETVGYAIRIKNSSILFIPDIDKWEKWKTDIRESAARFDYLFIDGSFYKDGEIQGRNMSEIPHPFVQESMQLFNHLSEREKKKIWFIHFNHTNPLMDINSAESNEVKNRGFNIAFEGLRIELNR